MLQDKCRSRASPSSEPERVALVLHTEASRTNQGKVGWAFKKSQPRFYMSNKENKKEFVAAGAPDFAMLNVKELEAFLKIDQKTIYRYVSLGLIPYVRIQSNIRFVKQQIVGWIEEQNFRPNSQIPTNQSKR